MSDPANVWEPKLSYPYYLGAVANAPLVDSGGVTLGVAHIGWFYWNTTTINAWIWNGTAWTLLLTSVATMANLVALSDAGGKYTAVEVEAAFAELASIAGAAIISTATGITVEAALALKVLISAPVLNGNVTGTGVLDEDDMVSDSAIKIATQQSIKAYIDTALAAVSFSGVGVKRVVDLVMADITWVPIDWTQVDSYDTDSLHNPAVNPTRLNLKTGTTFAKFSGYGRYTSSATSIVAQSARILKNGAVVLTVLGVGGVSDLSIPMPQVTIPCVDTDYFELELWHDSAGTMVMDASETEWQMECIVP